jgi:imidazolonepropionase-like amidohydrolase
MTIALQGGTVVDVDGTRAADLLVEAGEITAVGPDVAADAEEVLDVTGGYVAPGLVDAHVHLSMDGRPDVESMVGDSAPSAAYRVASNLRDALAAGVTTVRDLGADGTHAIDAGEAVREGVIDGPRVRACGRNVAMTGGHGHWFGREADGPHEVRKAAREQLKAGADVLKCMATGGVLTTGAQVGAPELTPAELETLCDVAAAAGVPTAAHAHGAEGIENAVRAGITSVEHGTFMDGAAAELLAEHDAYWVPTASALHGIVEHGVEAGIPEQAVEKAERAADAFDDAFDHALDAGVTVAMGTDAGTPFNHLRDAAGELAYMVEHGLSPAGALEAATTNAAALLGLDDVGRVAEGYAADLVVLDADPSTDVDAWADPRHVLARGERVA